MFVGVLRLCFGIVGAKSLKDKRRVVRSFKDRVGAKYRVSVAEIGELDDARYAWIGVAVVANEAAHCDEVLAAVATTAANLPDAILHDRATEIIPFGRAGSQIQPLAARSSSWSAAADEGSASASARRGKNRSDALSLGGTGDEDDD